MLTSCLSRIGCRHPTIVSSIGARGSFVSRGVVARPEDHADERPTGRGLCRGRKAKKKITAERKGVPYLVLRARRVCNHRGTAKRPSTPSHSASRHSIFFSPRPGSVPAAGHFPSGALRVRPIAPPPPLPEPPACAFLPLCRRVATSAPTL